MEEFTLVDFNREVVAGETIRLRVKFLDDLSESATASGVKLHVFEPDVTVDFDDPSNAFVQNETPLYVGGGVYEYDLSLPIDATEGTWHDAWYGMLNQQELEYSFNFSVVAGGTIQQIGNQIYPNNLIEVTVASGIRATDGTYLGEELSVEFLTKASPAYATTRKVRLSSGGFLSNVTDKTLQLAIVEASVEADVLNFKTDSVNTSIFQHARREYVTCLASSIILQNVANNTLKTKTLADIHVEYDTAVIQSQMQRLIDCMDRWQAQIMAGGHARGLQQAAGVVKGDLDPDRPIAGRMWYSVGNDQTSRRIPAGNNSYKPRGYRRYYKTFRRKYW